MLHFIETGLSKFSETHLLLWSKARSDFIFWQPAWSGFIFLLKKIILGASLVVQWLRLCASIAGGVGLTLGWRTKIPHAMSCALPKKHKVKNYL